MDGQCRHINSFQILAEVLQPTWVVLGFYFYLSAEKLVGSMKYLSM